MTESELLAALDRVYRRTEEIEGLAKELTADMGDVGEDFGNILGLSAGAEDAPVVKLLNTVFEEALKLRASDIHIEPQEKSLIIRFRIDGVLHVQTEADSKISTALVLRLKLMSGLDISEKRLPQDGRFNIKLRGDADRYADFDHADAIRRVGGDAPAGTEHRFAAARKAEHAAAVAGTFPPRDSPPLLALCW